LRHHHHAWLEQLKAVEEPGHLGVRAVPLRLACPLVVLPGRLGHPLGLDVRRHLGQGEVAARKHRNALLARTDCTIPG